MKKMDDFNADVLPEFKITEDSFSKDDVVESVAVSASNEPLSVQTLIAAGAGFGHRRIHNSMEPFVYSKTNTGCSINMDKSFSMIKYICGFLHEKVAAGYRVVIIGDRSSAEFSSVLSNYGKNNMVSYINKYRGGILTNFATFYQSITKYKELVSKKLDLESRIANAESRSLSSIVSGLKRVLNETIRTITKAYAGYDGSEHWKSPERCIFLTPSIKRSEKFIRELNQFNLRRPEDKRSYVIGLADSDADVSSAININYPNDDYRNYNKYVLPIFANDDKLNVLVMVLDTLFASINSGREAYDAVSKKASANAAKKPEKNAVRKA